MYAFGTCWGKLSVEEERQAHSGSFRYSQHLGASRQTGTPHLLQNRIDKHVLLLWTENPSPLDKRQTLQLILTNTITSSHGIQVMTANWLNFIWMYVCFISQFSASIQYINLLLLMLSGSCHVFKLNITKGVDHWQACMGSLVGLRQLTSTPEHHAICEMKCEVSLEHKSCLTCLMFSSKHHLPFEKQANKQKQSFMLWSVWWPYGWCDVS